ncbi:sodium/potassium-transporting ATPase subunit beta-2-like [Ischnura elegans]|uniref:sodium/potassium-transporting ATPase subunit beta-2-like n=1 Tax=Ischnura elegans TaxID=197161 RepID=UPI001ED88459|nr:sodium/potassium-transporting ATPase subunit beta-2-like [Ischnura elegans]
MEQTTTVPQEGSIDFATKYFVKPEEKPVMVRIQQALYNPKTGSILGRTPYLWGRVLLFYLIFYSCLAGLFSAMMKGLLHTIDETQPKYILEESLIGVSPGLGYRPMSIKYKLDSSLIRYVAQSRNNTVNWVDEIEEFLDEYKHPEKLPGNGKNLQTCSHDNPPKAGNVCSFELIGFEQCTGESGYGYNASNPCFFIKLNKIYGWVPEYYSPSELPEKMPDSLKEVIKSSVESDPSSINTVWLSCDGEGPADKDHIGPVSYYPKQGFPGYYYPYKNTPGYLSPLVAVQFKNPKKNVIINVECRAWAKNIVFQRKNQLGSCHFELMIDEPVVFRH